MIRLSCLMLLATTLASCGSSPPTHFYTLDPVPGPAAGSGRRGAPLVVGTVSLPGTLDRLALVTRDAGNQLDVSQNDRWAAPLDELTRRALSRDLRQRLPDRNVLLPGDPVPGNATRLTVTVQRFITEPSGTVDLNADWTTQAASPVYHETIQTQAASRSGSAIAAAMSEAIGALADRIAARY